MISVTFISNNNKTVSAPPDSNLLRVSLREQGGIPFKCGGGICGTCKCRIESGVANTDAIKAKERKHLTEADFANGYRMACQTFLTGDVSVSWQARPAGSGARKPEPAATESVPESAATEPVPEPIATEPVPAPAAADHSTAQTAQPE